MASHHQHEAQTPVKALLVDDSRMQYVMMRDFLAVTSRSRITLDWVATFAEGLEAVRAQHHDVYLIDYQLDAHDGLELLTQAIAEGCQAPMIFITAHDDPALDQAAMQAGAVDYLDKSDLKPAGLERAIRYATERTKVLTDLRKSEAAHRRLLAVTKQQANELLMLDEARNVLGDCLNITDIGSAIMLMLNETFGYDHVCLYLRNGSQFDLQDAIGCDTLPPQLPVDTGLPGMVFASKEPVLLADALSPDSFLGPHAPVISEMAVPLLDVEQVVGLLCIGVPHRLLTETDLQLIHALGYHLGNAIVRTRLYADVKASESRFRTLTELISDFAFSMTVGADGILEPEWITGETFARITGYTPADLLKEGIFAVFHPEDLGIVREQMALVMQGQASTRQLRIVTRSKTIRWLEVYCRPDWDQDGQSVIRLYGIAQDITRRKQVEIAEHEQRVLAEALLQTSAALNSTLDLDEIFDQILLNVGRVVPHRAAGILMIHLGSVRMARISGIDSAPANVLLAQRRNLDQTPLVRHVYETGQPLIIPNVLDSADSQSSIKEWIGGGITHADILTIRSVIMTPIHIEGEVIGALMLTSDIVDHFTPVMGSHLQAFSNQMALAIRNARQYEQAQELAALNERQRLARDLHDAVSQTLFSANIIAQTLPRLWTDSPPPMQEQLTELRHLTGLALAEMRSLLTELRPHALIDTNLRELLEQAADMFKRRARADIALHIDPSISLPTEVKIVMYRIAQEALNNAAKHARADQVGLTLQQQDGMVELCISDNGRGFDLAQIPSNHFGMRIMQERAESIGAACQVISQPGQGTSITVGWHIPG